MGALLKEIEELSEESKAKVVEFVRLMKSTEENEQKKRTEKPKRTAGTLKGHLKYMAEDFDETPDCFKEYM